MCKNRTVTNGLHTTHTNFTNVLWTAQKWQCGVQFLLMALFATIFFFWECRRAYSNCECRELQSHAGSTSAQWVILFSTRFAVVPTRRSNCSHSMKFHASPQDNVSRQIHFSFQGHHLACSPVRLTLQCQTTSFGATLKARYMKHILPILMT